MDELGTTLLSERAQPGARRDVDDGPGAAIAGHAHSTSLIWRWAYGLRSGGPAAQRK